jgi:hypothetical protein
VGGGFGVEAWEEEGGGGGVEEIRWRERVGVEGRSAPLVFYPMVQNSCEEAL